MTTSSDTTILVVDDHPVVRDGLRSLIDDSPGLVLVAEAEDGHQAVTLAAEHRPDVVLMDLGLPGIDGVEATRQIVAAGHAGAVLVLTMNDDDGAVIRAMRSGARGYLLKGSPGHEIVEAIRIVSTGRAILGGAVAERMDRFFSRPRSQAASDAFPQLSGRETEILALVAQGLANDEISNRLVLSKKTVQNNISTILTKIGTPTRAQAIARARDAGLC